MTHTYVYRGVTYTNKNNEQVAAKRNGLNTGLVKIYRSIAYDKLPKVKHQVLNHTYRGVEFAA